MGRPLPTYRLYKLSPAGLIAGPPEDFDAVSDDIAVSRMHDVAAKEAGIQGYELWERARRVAVLSKESKA